MWKGSGESCRKGENMKRVERSDSSKGEVEEEVEGG